MMPRIALSFLLAALALTAPAQAQDPRLVERMYDPYEVVTVEGRVNVQATIMFGEGEQIENVAIGNSQTWQVTPNKRANLLFVKPLSPSAKTNMTVVTNKNTYLFDLVANPKARPLYVLRFTYPEPIEEVEIEPSSPQMAAGPDALERQAVEDPYAVVDPALVNTAWNKAGDPSLLPNQAWDDGESTFLTWDEDRDIPAILIENSKGVEGPVNYAVRDDTIVVDGVPNRLILRRGDDMAELLYAGPGPLAALAAKEND